MREDMLEKKVKALENKIRKFEPTCEAKQLLEIKDGTITALESCTLSFNGGRIVATKGDTIEIYGQKKICGELDPYCGA